MFTSADYARESEENRIAQRRVKAPRGLIYDRDGRILARTRPFYTVSLERTSQKDFDAATAAFTEAIGDLELDGKYSRKYRTIRLKRDVDFRTVSIVEERLKADWPLLDIEIETQRHYPYGTVAAPLARLYRHHPGPRSTGQKRQRLCARRLYRQDRDREGVRKQLARSRRHDVRRD